MKRSKNRIPWGRLFYWDLLFHSLYLCRSVSFDIWLASRKTDVDFGELKFGETNLKSIQAILAKIPINSDSTIFELGCGRGRAAFLLHFLTGAKIVAIDVVGPFITTGRRLARWTGCEQHLLFSYENFLDTELSDADVVYACALCFSQSTRENLAKNLKKCRPGTYLVSVGWNPKRSWLKPLEHFTSRFSWGQATLYISQIQHSEPSSESSRI